MVASIECVLAWVSEVSNRPPPLSPVTRGDGIMDDFRAVFKYFFVVPLVDQSSGSKRDGGGDVKLAPALLEVPKRGILSSPLACPEVN